MNNYYNILIDIIGIILVCSIFFVGRVGERHENELNIKILNNLMICCLVVFLFDILGLALDGETFPGARIILWTVDSFYWIFQIVYCWVWMIFADYWAFESKERLKKRGAIYAIPMLVEIVLIVSNISTGWIFTLDELNTYTRGEYYLPNMTPYFIYITGALLITFDGYRANINTESKRRILSLIIYMFMPICGVIFATFFYGISWVWPMVALSLLLVYLNVQQQIIAREQLAVARAETMMAESLMAIMLSQIQPHFLYNSLNTIDALCDVDTKEAQKAIRSFAKYLRGNLDTLSRKVPVPFEEELSHLQQYLTLENFRFDKIQVIYDIEAKDFMLPSLSLQPIVENAVKHGILQRKEGGTIIISTRCEQDYIRLTVQDDGVGFDVTKEPDNSRSHTGIINVRSRLEAMCGGRLIVESAPNVGTIVTFIIPKGGSNLCEPLQ